MRCWVVTHLFRLLFVIRSEIKSLEVSVCIAIKYIKDHGEVYKGSTSWTGCRRTDYDVPLCDTIAGFCRFAGTSYRGRTSRSRRRIEYLKKGWRKGGKGGKAKPHFSAVCFGNRQHWSSKQYFLADNRILTRLGRETRRESY